MKWVGQISKSSVKVDIELLTVGNLSYYSGCGGVYQVGASYSPQEFESPSQYLERLNTFAGVGESTEYII